jgi:hypothetical protein
VAVIRRVRVTVAPQRGIDRIAESRRLVPVFDFRWRAVHWNDERARQKIRLLGIHDGSPHDECFFTL